jgi:hypothetical protein
MAKSPPTMLFEALRASEQLKSAKCDVKFGRKALTFTGAKAPRVVIVPATGRYREPRDNRATAGLDLRMQIHVWGVDYDQAWELHCRTLDAVKKATIGVGYGWVPETLDHDETPDSESPGEVMIIQLTQKLDVQPASSETTALITAVNTNSTNT